MRPINETKLLLNTQRYQKLQHVAVLLKQAQDIQRYYIQYLRVACTVYLATVRGQDYLLYCTL